MTNKNKSVEEVVEEFYLVNCHTVQDVPMWSTKTAVGALEHLRTILTERDQTSQEREREMKKEFIETLHQIIPHTVLELEETGQTDYDRGYIFYQNLVVRAVLDAEEEINQTLTNPNKD